MYNDQFMALFMLCAIATLTLKVHKWIIVTISSILLSVALSIKAGVVLLLPAYFGVIQYRFGLPYLLLSISLLISFQILVAAPFIIEFGGKTSISTYLKMSKLLGGDEDNEGKGRGARYENSIMWRFISSDSFYSDFFMTYTQLSIIVLNIYHFFIKLNALPRCLSNLICSASDLSH